MNIQPPRGLLERILKRIHREERVLFFKKVAFLSVALVGSLASLAPSFENLLNDFNSTGFVNFFSLIFSDFSAVYVYWQNFTMILLETLPVLSLALFMAVLLVFLQSAKSLIKNLYEHKQYFRIETV